MSKSLKYQPYAKLSSHGEVEGTQCECTAGHTGDAHCKHVIVLLLAIADLKEKGVFITELSCTEKLQTFHKPKGTFKGTPLKVSAMKKGKQATSSNRSAADDDKDQYYVTWFHNHMINGGSNSTMPIKCINPPANPFAVEADHNYSSLSVTQSIVNCLHLEDITADEVKQIEIKTRGQANNEKWHVHREGRLTASKFFQFVKGSGKPILAHNSLYPTKFSSDATNHGIKYEPTAVENYVKDYKVAEKVEECGLFILESHPFIAGSPDRLLGEDGIIEIKCPYSTRDKEVHPDNQPYLVFSEDGELKLKETDKYYYQVQGQLLVTGRAFCDFVVYTFKDLKRIIVPRNDVFIDLLFCDLHEFYFRYMKPAVMNKYFFRDYDKCGLHDLGYCARD